MQIERSCFDGKTKEIVLQLPKEVHFTGITLVGRDLILSWKNTSEQGHRHGIISRLKMDGPTNKRLHNFVIASQEVLGITASSAQQPQGI